MTANAAYQQTYRQRGLVARNVIREINGLMRMLKMAADENDMAMVKKSITLINDTIAQYDHSAS